MPSKMNFSVIKLIQNKFTARNCVKPPCKLYSTNCTKHASHALQIQTLITDMVMLQSNPSANQTEVKLHGTSEKLHHNQIEGINVALQIKRILWLTKPPS